MKRVFALLLALLLLCGCGARQEPAAQTQPAPQQETEPTAVPDGTPGMAYEPDAGFDPYDCMSVCNRLVLELTYQPLFTVQPDGTVDPVLATGWSVSEDGMTTTVTIRSGVTLHSGETLTAADAARSVRRAAAGAYYADRFQYLADVTAPDETTLRFTTWKAYECFPLLLDIPICGDDVSDGTGAYVLRDDMLRRVSDRGDLPQTVALLPADSGETLRDAFQFGGVSVTAQDPNGDQPLYFGGDYEIWDVPTSTLQFIGFRMDGLFSDGGLRTAVCSAVDRDAIVAADMEGYGVATALLARPGSPWYSAPLAETAVYDPSRLSALARSDATASMIVCGDNPQRTASAKRVAETLTACGLRTTLRELSAREFAAALADGEYDLYYGEIRLSPDFDFSPLLRAAAPTLFETELLETLCDLTRANSGNAYDLQKAVLTDGLLCPVAYKTAAVCGKRTLPFAVTPHLNGWSLPTE